MPDLAHLRRSLRWSALTRLVAGWYERPLEDADGEPEAALRAAEERLGHRLPAALAEWFLLVGRRVTACEQVPVPLRVLGSDEVTDVVGEAEDEGLVIYAENQACWLASVSSGFLAEDDPPVGVEGSEEWVCERLSAFLCGMVLIETMTAIDHGWERGPLGTLARGITGGCVAIAGAPLALERLAPPLLGPEWAHGSTFRPIHGDDELLVEGSETLRWAARTDAARRRLEARVSLAPEGPFELQARISASSEDEAWRLFAAGEALRAELADGPPRRLSVTSGRARGEVLLELATSAPDDSLDPPGALALVRGLLEGAGAGGRPIEAGYRAANQARFTPLAPEGLTAFAIRNTSWSLFD